MFSFWGTQRSAELCGQVDTKEKTLCQQPSRVLEARGQLPFELCPPTMSRAPEPRLHLLHSTGLCELELELHQLQKTRLHGTCGKKTDPGRRRCRERGV